MTLPFGLSDVRQVVFYKRDEITTDLICCDVEVASPDGMMTWFNHEESNTWKLWIDGLASLSGFDKDWHAKVGLPTFAPSVTIAYVHAASGSVA